MHAITEIALLETYEMEMESNSGKLKSFAFVHFMEWDKHMQKVAIWDLSAKGWYLLISSELGQPGMTTADYDY